MQNRYVHAIIIATVYINGPFNEGFDRWSMAVSLHVQFFHLSHFGHFLDLHETHSAVACNREAVMVAVAWYIDPEHGACLQNRRSLVNQDSHAVYEHFDLWWRLVSSRSCAVQSMASWIVCGVMYMYDSCNALNNAPQYYSPVAWRSLITRRSGEM